MTDYTRVMTPIKKVDTSDIVASSLFFLDVSMIRSITELLSFRNTVLSVTVWFFNLPFQLQG